MAMIPVYPGGQAVSGGSGTPPQPLLVAASDAPAAVRAAAALVCDGTADDVQINAAIQALSADGGVVQLSFGTFALAAPILIDRDNVTLVGAGTGQRSGATQTGKGTRLVVQTGLTTQAILVQRTANDRPCYGVLLRDFTIDGALVGTAVDGIVFRSNRGLIDHVHVHKMSGSGFRINGYPGWNTYDTVISFVQAGDNLGAGLFFDTNTADEHVLGSVFYNNQDNIIIKGASQQITNSHTYNATRYNIWFQSAGSRTKFSNCKIEGAGQHGVYLDGSTAGTSDVQFTGCNFKNSGDSADNSYDHVFLDGLSSAAHSRTLFVGNMFSYQSSVTPNKPRYAINLSTTAAQSTVIVANSFGPVTHWGTAPINDGSSQTLPAFIKSNLNVPEVVAASIINVRDYGAKGNGAFDDTAAIQAALDAVPAGGARVFFPAGNYELHAPLLVRQQGTVLAGEGAGQREGGSQPAIGSRLEVDATFVGTEVIRFQNAANDRCLYGAGMQDLAISGLNGAASVNGVVFKVSHGFVRNVNLHAIKGDALTLTGYSGFRCEQNKITDSWIYQPTGVGINLSTDALDNTIAHVTIDGPTGNHVTVGATDHAFLGCTFVNGSADGLALLGVGSRTRVNACKFSTIGHHAIEMDGTAGNLSDVTIVGNLFRTCGITTDNTYACVSLAGPASSLTRIHMTGNEFSYVSGDSTSKAKYGVDLSSSAVANCTLSGNTFGPASHWGTAATHVASSPTGTFVPNQGGLTDGSGIVSIADGGTITHGLARTPTFYAVQATVAGEFASVTAVSSTTMTVALRKHDGTAGTTANVVWQARV